MLKPVIKTLLTIMIGCHMFACGNLSLFAQAPFSCVPQLATVQLKANGDSFAPALIRQERDEKLEISFDELSHDVHRYSYRLLHCNADWVPSDLPESAFLDGFNPNPVEEYEPSASTSVPYTHYRVTIPNERVRLKLSGNYLFQLFDEDEASDTPLLSVGFRVAEALITVEANVCSDTDIDRNRRHQQLSFTLHHRGYEIRNPQQELKVEVMQNGRTDNAVRGVLPSFIGQDVVKYEHLRPLIFPASNEYRRFETVTTCYLPLGVEAFSYHAPYYHAVLRPDVFRNGHYLYDDDHNGYLYIRNAESDRPDTEADYYLVHFTLQMPEPLPDGELYLQGGFTHGCLDERFRLQYHPQERAYTSIQLLKQGAYDYHYLYLPHGKQSAQTALVEGDFYNTENEYLLLVYHRKPGERYDRLIAHRRIFFP
ncbi:MAG: DUF5103 domain-containing protein [Bacteroides sp.]|nr:DUF5103 domain-containing protein [Bacteroides sp.]